MAYMHIENLYRKPEFLNLFKTVWVLEKVHGSSASITLCNNDIKFFAGGASHPEFVKLFDQEKLQNKFSEMTDGHQYIVYGEAYGGKMQGMSHTYGKELKFIAFDVKIITPNKPEGFWMDVYRAEKFAHSLGLEFVWNTTCENTLENLNYYRDQESKQAVKNIGISGLPAEGIVVKPLTECQDKFGTRWIVKHKRAEFGETRTKREVSHSPEYLQQLSNCKDIAWEWVTEMRLNHVLDKIEQPYTMEKIGTVIKSMIEDVKRESTGEVVWSKDVEKQIGHETAKLFKEKIGFGRIN